MVRGLRRWLTEEEVRTARRLWREGWTAKELAEELDANEATLYQAVRGRTWKHVPGAVTERVSCVLSDAIVRRARAQWWRGWRTQGLAEEYGVSTSTMDAALRGRTWSHIENPITERHDSRGEACPSVKLTSRQVLEARRLYKSGWTFAELGEHYGVTSVAMLYAVRGRNWRHLPGAVEDRWYATGEGQPSAKLNPDRVRAIRRRSAAGESASQMAREYGVHPSTVLQVVRRQTWKHIR